MFGLIRNKKATIPVTLDSSNAELEERVDGLADDEVQVYKWLRQYYSESWIAETLFISKAQLKVLTESLCRKLGVPCVRAMLRIYSRLDVPSLHEPVDTKAIDSYVEKRTETEIQKQLKRKLKSE